MALTRRETLKMLVKVKVDELSPFDSLHGDSSTEDFIAAGGDADYNEVNPISSYIEKSLDPASEFCMRDLPTSVLVRDFDYDTEDVMVDMRGVGHIFAFDRNYRLVRLSAPSEWNRDCTTFITPLDEDYVKQQTPWTRGGSMKPVVAFVPEKEELELYSFSVPHGTKVKADVYYIDCNKAAEKVKSQIDDYIALRCAAYVLEILGDEKKAAVLMEEYEIKKKGLLQ